MSHLSFILTILSSLIFLSFFVLYNKDILNGSEKPNIVSWGLFSLITLINSITYIVFTHDALKGMLAFTDCFTCIIITCLIVFEGDYRKLNISEKIIILLVMISLLIWYILHSAIYANLLLQPAYILAFVPTLRSTWQNPHNEIPLVWSMWALSFLLTIGVILLRWNNNFADLVNPLIAFTLHISVALLALRKIKID